MNQYLAQKLIIIDPDKITPGTTPTGYAITGPLPTTAGGGYKFNTIADVVNVGTNILFPLAFIIAFLYLVWAGFNLAKSMGDPEALKKSQTQITNAVVGLILLSLSYWLAQILTRIFF